MIVKKQKRTTTRTNRKIKSMRLNKNKKTIITTNETQSSIRKLTKKIKLIEAKITVIKLQSR